MNHQALYSDRRQFLLSAFASGTFFTAHGLFAIEKPMAKNSPQNTSSEPRIKSLELLTSVPLEKMKQFYHDSLGFKIIEEKSDRLTIAGGKTPITFVKSSPEEGKPFYHFAFNIPENKILSAHKWQKKRSELLPIPKTLRDPKFPDEVVNYSHWNAHSIFFFDPAENVVEYIARHDLKNTQEGDFDSKDILYASEIAFVVDDVTDIAKKLGEQVGIEPYKGASDQFTALGDEYGLLLVMKRGRMISFEATPKKEVTVFRTKSSVRGQKSNRYSLPKFPYEVLIEE
jgi:hypothetical protein